MFWAVHPKLFIADCVDHLVDSGKLTPTSNSLRSCLCSRGLPSYSALTQHTVAYHTKDRRVTHVVAICKRAMFNNGLCLVSSDASVAHISFRLSCLQSAVRADCRPAAATSENCAEPSYPCWVAGTSQVHPLRRSLGLVAFSAQNGDVWALKHKNIFGVRGTGYGFWILARCSCTYVHGGKHSRTYGIFCGLDL